ncbi:MAG: type IX secretion system outer membrane channel protein PorV [Bacteroidales bacterium]|nr:type IX secretion system outer membrane channel protein PorV [Bacteroidales bacterium]
MNTKKIIPLLSFLCLSTIVFAQQVNDDGAISTGQVSSDVYNVITTAVPFMTITPDSRSGAMGDVGVATSTDVWSQHWNASKYALAEEDMSIGVSYTPWLENLGIKDINLLYLAGYKKLDDQQAVGASLRYFSMGEIPAYNEQGISAGYSLTPKEYAIDLSYSRYLSDFFVMGMTGRFIYSNLGVTSEDYEPGKAVAADISGTFFKPITISGNDLDLQIGASISNLGNKVTYSMNQKDFIPTNLRIGAGISGDIDQYNSLKFYVDFNKLLVPTPPLQISYEDTLGNKQTEIIGYDDNIGTIAGVFQSFYDAPAGAEEELKEITIGTGLEYWYNQEFAIRGGYFHESETKGNRKYFTIGAGLRLNVFGLDFSYLIPTQGTNSPLANTFRFSLTFDFEGIAEENKDLQSTN